MTNKSRLEQVWLVAWFAAQRLSHSGFFFSDCFEDLLEELDDDEDLLDEALLV